MLGLIIPSSASGGAGDLGGFVLPSEHVSSAQRSTRLGRLLDDEDEGFNLDPGFTFDDEGNLIEQRTPAQVAVPSGGMRLGSDTAVSARMPQEISEENLAGPFDVRLHPISMPHGAKRCQREPMDLDVHLPRFDDDDNIVAVAEPFPAMEPPDRHLRTSPSEVRQEHESSESAVAPLPRKTRAPKQLPVDARQELHNADLARWKADYADNMAEAVKAKKSHKATALAKKNAAFWVVGTGIGGVGAGLGTSKLKSPLDMFAGDSMFEALTGIIKVTTGLKRGRDGEEDHDSDSEARRVRMRDGDGDGDQVGRGDGMILDDDEGTMPISAGEVTFGGTLTSIED